MTHEPCANDGCDEMLRQNQPGVSTQEAPYWTLTREKDTDREVLGTVEFLYFCSDECVVEFINGS